MTRQRWWDTAVAVTTVVASAGIVRCSLPRARDRSDPHTIMGFRGGGRQHTGAGALSAGVYCRKPVTSPADCGTPPDLHPVSHVTDG